MSNSVWCDRSRLGDLDAVLSHRWTPEERMEVHRAQMQDLDLGLPSGTGLAVDLGCGLGRFTNLLAERWSWAIGIDGSEGMVARSRYKPAVAGTIEQLPLADRSVACMLTVSTFQLLNDLSFAVAVREIARVARPRANLIMLEGSDPATHQAGKTPSWGRGEEQLAALMGSDFELLECARKRYLTDNYLLTKWVRR